MRAEPGVTLQKLKELFGLLIGQPRLRRGPAWKADWKTEWEGWDQVTWRPGCCGLYVLWRGEDDLEDGRPPVYIGEGIVGTRLWDSFNHRAEWQFAQILYDERIEGTSDGRNWRRLLERFAIVVLRPEENVG